MSLSKVIFSLKRSILQILELIRLSIIISLFSTDLEILKLSFDLIYEGPFLMRVKLNQESIHA